MHLWAERYDRSLDDIFAVQDEVAQTIVSTLVGRIEDAKLQQSLRKPTVSLAAYDCLLRGLAHFRGYADDDNQQACEMFERAIALDPRYAVAHAYLALARVALHGYAAAPAEVLDGCVRDGSARSRTGPAGEPLPSRCSRHLLSTAASTISAEHHFRRALELNPNDADGMRQMGYLLAQRGRPEEALGWMEAAMRLNPFHPTWYNFASPSRFIRCGATARRRRRSSDCPTRGHGHVRGWRPATPSSGDGEAQAQVSSDPAAPARLLDGRLSFAGSPCLSAPKTAEHLREGLIRAGLPEYVPGAKPAYGYTRPW